tara:strand:+ start:215 stop:1144 length:930 start_codon:yes stop_codon:yes gene_type:complete
MGTALDIYDKQTLTAKDVQAQINLIQQVMEQTMKEGVHYGKVPGCGDKPALFKPGAEKVLATFRLSANPDIEDLSTTDEIRYRIKAEIVSASGTIVGYGVGEASSNEDKYKWRKAVCDAEFNETPEDRKRKKWKKGYGNAKDFQVPQIRTDIADIANTILKMAKKRSLVDGVLTSTACSDIFEQDIEDLEGVIDMDKKDKKPPVKPTQSKSSKKDIPVSEGEIVIKVKSIGKKKTKKNPRYTIYSVEDVGYSTFDQKIADDAKEIEGTDIEALVIFKTDQYGNNIQVFDVITPVEDDGINPSENANQEV